VDEEIVLPPEALVVLAGPAACGKSTLAARHFAETQVVSSDRLRAWLTDDETDQSVSGAAFQLLYDLVGKRLALRRLTVVDSTALSTQTRKDLLQLGRSNHVPVVLLVLVADAALCLERDRKRARQVGPLVIGRQIKMLHDTLQRAPQEGFDQVYQVDARNIAQVQIRYEPPAVDRRADHGPFDIIGDVHGCADELTALLERLGYGPRREDGVWHHAGGRRAVFLGDLTDRGPASVAVLRRVWPMVRTGTALYVPGNHCNKLMRYLKGNRVRVGHGLEKTIAEFDALPPRERKSLAETTVELIATAPPYLWLDEGALVVTHAGIKAGMIGQVTERIRAFCLYGDVSGALDERGFPVRREWAADYRGEAAVVYGHAVHPVTEWVNNTINIDQGCVFGGELTALQWPERTLVQVPARRAYADRDTPDTAGGG
jgi:protein phosphatase